MKLDEFLAQVSEELGTDPALIGEVRDDLLDLTRDIAHNAIRPAAPLSAFLVGLSVGSGASAAEIREQIAKVTALVEKQA
ncbi:hypothetical protein CKALI_10100 [Corynebacterium kalinowskii]|uniref:DUF6457 domain-containing protein n=1 Tax=Corynebacterium kalinowskii TaxID=2675216 RepID=A0A6B8VVD3_9CORY|nr:DUF6457 domain-containing protein [Corynebacterium kalinowskii]QGU02875.1 hypothetical protein CKALI_10100 [Corynebacterium kalinowskii]